MDFNDAVFDGRSDIAGPTTRRPRPPPPPPPAVRAETPPKKRRGRPPRKKASGVQAVNGGVAASEESSGTHPGTSGGASRAGAPPMQMPPPPQPPQPPLVPSTSSTIPSRKLHDTSTPMPPSPSFSSPIPPPADGVPPVLMVTTLARQAESLARREKLSREVDRAVEEINLQLLQDRDMVTGRDGPPASSGKSPRTGSDLQASGGGKGGRPSSSAPSPVVRIVSSYVPTRQTMADFERLDVLVCGMCKSVFHNIDEFKSHSSTCTKRPGTAASGAEIFENVEDLSSESAVAMVIWCNTIRRVLVQSGVQIDDMGDLRRLLQSKWYRLSHRARSTWLRAAKSLISLGQKGRLMFGGREKFPNLVEEVMPLTGAECRPVSTHIKQELAESWEDLGINANLPDSGRPLPKIPIPISQETIELIRAAATATTAPEKKNEKAAPTRARSIQTVTVATKSQATLTKETPKKVRSSSCQTEEPKTQKERSIAVQTEAADANDDDKEVGKKKEVVEVLANRGNEYYVLYKDRPHQPVWEKESAIDEALIQTFKERTNPHLMQEGVASSVSAADNGMSPLPEIPVDGVVPKSPPSAATNIKLSGKGPSRRKSGAPIKVTKEETLSEKRSRRRKPEKPSKVSDKVDGEMSDKIAPEKISNEEAEVPDKNHETEETPKNAGNEVLEESSSEKDFRFAEKPPNEVIKTYSNRKRSKASTGFSSTNAPVSPRSRRKSSAQALTKFRKWGADEEEEEEEEDIAKLREAEHDGTTSTTDVDKVVSEFQAELDLDMSPVDDSGMLASHRGHCDPDYLAREETKREREEARKSRLISEKLKLTEELDVAAEMDSAEEPQVLEDEDAPDPNASPRRSQRATAGKRSTATTGDRPDTSGDGENQDESQDKNRNQDEEENKKQEGGGGSVQDGVITIGGEGQPSTLVQAANQQLGVVPKRKRGRPPKNRDAQGNPIPAKAAKPSTPKKRGPGRPPKRKIIDDDDEDEDYVPMRASNVNLLSDLFRTTDEDTNDEEQESDLKKLSSGLTIRPVESSEEHKTKRSRQSLKMILGGRRAPLNTGRRRSSRKKKRRILDDEDDEDVDDEDERMDEDDFSFADDTDDHDDDFAGGRGHKREAVPANLAKLVPEGFRMVRHLNEKGVVEYRVKKAGPGQAVVARKSAPKEKEPRLVEFGARRSSSSAREDSADNVIFVGHGPRHESGGRESGTADGGRRGTDARDGGLGTGGPEGNTSSGPFVKLTYRPSEEELEVSRKQQESLVAHQKQAQSTSSSGTGRTASVTTATGGTTTTTTLSSAPSATRLSPLSHEVTSTTEGDEEVTFTAETISNAVAEYSLDPSSGVLVDKDGNPLQAPLANVGSDVPNAEMVMLPTSASTATLHSAGAVEQQVVVNLPQTTSSDIQVSYSGITAASHADRSSLVVAPHSVHQPGEAEAHMLFTNASSAPQPAVRALQQQLPGTPTLTLDPSTSFTTGTLQLSDDGTLSSLPASAPAGTTHLATAAGIAPGGGSDGTSNKVLLVLPGGQMILTDLTDEQCGQLNIQVGGSQTQHQQQQPPSLEQPEVLTLPADGTVFQSASESEGNQSVTLDGESKEGDREGERSGRQQGPPTLIQPLPPDDASTQKHE